MSAKRKRKPVKGDTATFIRSRISVRLRGGEKAFLRDADDLEVINKSVQNIACQMRERMANDALEKQEQRRSRDARV